MKRNSELSVGLAVLAGIAIVVVGTIWMKGEGLGREEVTITARFREVGRLLEGNAVKLRGVPIGRVEEIALDPTGTGVLVSMRIEDDVRLPPDPVAILSPESMFGDWQAEIHARAQFPGYRYAITRDPDVLPGYSLPDISRLTAVADRIAENLAVLTDRVELAFTEETARNVSLAIENIQEVSTQLTGLVSAQQETVEKISVDLEETVRLLGEAAETVNRTFAAVEDALEPAEIEAIVGNIRLATARVDSLSVELLVTSKQLSSTVAAADSLVGPAGQVVGRISRGEGTLGALVQDTTLYRQLVDTNRVLQALLLDIQENPRKYVNLEIF